jgi:choline dehydrogenase-like flavoprotein
MPNLNTKANSNNTFDAIVIGSGISGGWAAKELCEKGLKTLVLERGRNIEHINKDTYSDKKHFFSYRRSVHNNEPDYGRCISIICRY